MKSWLACPLRRRITLWLGGGVPLMASLALMPPPPGADQRIIELPLAVDSTATVPEAAEPTTSLAPDWLVAEVKRNDTLGSIFQRLGLPERDAYLLNSSSKRARQLVSQLRPGQEVRVLRNEQQQLQTLRLVSDKLHYTEFTRDTANAWHLQEVTLTPDVLYGFAEATIDESLFRSANDAGIDDRLTMKLADIFGWDIDFVQDIRSGDSFHIVYEELYLNGEKIADGDIVAAEFRNRGQAFRAVRYTNRNGENNYYTPEGNSMRKEFLRSPIEFARISSHFNLKRKHPILHTIRAHKGTDYAASRGTPVRATGDGRVSFVGNKGGYGRTVILQHGAVYETRYGHLQNYARGVRNGSRVKQGQVIGYVGSSGLATGPHLHYEFHVNGIERNPVTVKFPLAASIPAEEKALFLAQTSLHLVQLASYLGRPAATQLALVE